MSSSALRVPADVELLAKRRRQAALPSTAIKKHVGVSHPDALQLPTFAVRTCSFFETKHTEWISVVTKSHETPNAGRRPTTLPTKLQKPPHMFWPTCGSHGVPTREPFATSWRYFPCSGKRQQPDHVNRFFAPLASGF